MLHLTDPQWRELQGLYGSSEDVPRLLARLQEEYVTQVRDKLYWEHLYHQNTLYSCTYAAVPYLAELARNASNPATKLDITFNAAFSKRITGTIWNAKFRLSSPQTKYR